MPSDFKDDVERMYAMHVPELEETLEPTEGLESADEAPQETDPRSRASNRDGGPDALDASSERAESDLQTRYREYLLALEDLPVLSDVVCEPPRVVIRDFRLGQRPDARKCRREDPYTLKEHDASDLEQRYLEYVEILSKSAAEAVRPVGRTRAGGAVARKPSRKKAPPKPRRRSKRRKA